MCQQVVYTLPLHASLAPPVKHTEPKPAYMVVEELHRAVVARQAVIHIMSSEHLAQPDLLVGHRCMHPTPGFYPQCLQLLDKPLALRLPLDHETPIPSPPTIMGETQEGERRTPQLVPPGSTEGRQPAKLDQAGLVFVERKAKLRQSLLIDLCLANEPSHRGSLA